LVYSENRITMKATLNIAISIIVCLSIKLVTGQARHH